MKRFEYCYMQVDNGHLYQDFPLFFSNGQNMNLRGKQLPNVLDDLGKNGWEMVGTGHVGENYHIVYFKREIEG